MAADTKICATIAEDQRHAQWEMDHELERLQAELKFAQALCERHPESAAAWQGLIEKAAAGVDAAALSGGLAGLRAAVRAAEETLAPLAETAKSYVIHCTGHAHIDMNWMWSWPETVAITNDTFTTVLALMEEFPAFRFSQSQASVYAIIEEHNPALLERIAERVREGRWEVTASHWVEGDKNLAGGESLCRHLLYTRRYMEKLFGLSPADVPVDWAPDTFGHAATVPTYLARGGVRYVYMHRPGAHGERRRRAFHWAGPDGSRVLVHNDMGLGYNGVLNPHIADHTIAFAAETGSRHSLFVYGVGDHGGGPTRRDILQGLEMNSWPIFPEVRFSTVKAYFEALEGAAEDLPTLSGELNFEFTGCYTTQTLIKKANRFGENRLRDAELAASWAWAVDRSPYPAARFTQGWQDTLFSHFHDILPGSGVHDTRTYTHGLYQKTMATTGVAETAALRHVAGLVDTSGCAGPAPRARPARMVTSAVGAGVGFRAADGQWTESEQSGGEGNRPIVFFNPTGAVRREVAEVTIWDKAVPGSLPLKEQRFVARDSGGVALAVQRVEEGQYWGHQYVRLAFPVDVPALGYALYSIEAGALESSGAAAQIGRSHHCSYSRHEREPEGLENEFIRLELDMETGGIQRLVHKASGIELVSPDSPPSGLEYGVERHHGMSSWLVDHTGPLAGAELKAVRRTGEGPWQAGLALDFALHASTFTLTYEVRHGDPALHVHLSGTWFERGSEAIGVPVLRYALPLALAQARGRYEIPFGAIDRDLNSGEEVPALQWAQVRGQSPAGMGGVLLVNDCKYGHSLEGSTLRVTLIRSSYQPDPLPEIGSHEMRFAILPFAGDLSVTEAIQAGAALNHPLRPVGTGVHAGRLPSCGQFIAVEGDGIVVAAVKKAEDSDALLVRLVNPTEADTEATLRFAAAVLGTPARASLVDLLEVPAGEAAVDGAAVMAAVPARGIATVAVEFAAP